MKMKHLDFGVLRLTTSGDYSPLGSLKHGYTLSTLILSKCKRKLTLSGSCSPQNSQNRGSISSQVMLCSIVIIPKMAVSGDFSTKKVKSKGTIFHILSVMYIQFMIGRFVGINLHKKVENRGTLVHV